jgi:hypothetical protein
MWHALRQSDEDRHFPPSEAPANFSGDLAGAVLPMMNLHEWIQVVPPSLLTEGEAAYARWLAEHELGQEQISPDDIRVDVIRTREGSRMRYLVRRETLERLGVADDYEL